MSTFNVGVDNGIYLPEIRNMMYAFGDVKSCNSDTAILIEHITHRQIVDLVKEAHQISQSRGAKCISMTDVLFLLRYNKVKLTCVIQYMQTKHFIQQTYSSEVYSDNKEDDEDDLITSSKQRKYSLEFLSEADKKDVMNGKEIDEFQLQRQQKLDSQTKSMDLTEYTEFTESRRASFNKNIKKFKLWLNVGSILPENDTQILDVLAYLAYLTVQEIVESARTIKTNQEYAVRLHVKKNLDPTRYRESDSFVRSSICSGNDTPEESPATTRYTSENATSKKRRLSSKPDESTTPIATPTAIQPAHVHEAMRKQMEQLVGPHLPLSRHFIKRTTSSRSFCKI